MQEIRELWNRNFIFRTDRDNYSHRSYSIFKPVCVNFERHRDSSDWKLIGQPIMEWNVLCTRTGIHSYCSLNWQLYTYNSTNWIHDVYSTVFWLHKVNTVTLWPFIVSEFIHFTHSCSKKFSFLFSDGQVLNNENKMSARERFCSWEINKIIRWITEADGTQFIVQFTFGILIDVSSWSIASLRRIE